MLPRAHRRALRRTNPRRLRTTSTPTTPLRPLPSVPECVQALRNKFLRTIAWSPPETLRGQACTGASDVYSFGIILYELLTRKIPYRNLQMAEVVIGVLSASNLRPSMIGCEGVLGQDVMKKAWNVEPKTRPTFTQIVIDLDIMLQSNNDGLSQSVDIV